APGAAPVCGGCADLAGAPPGALDDGRPLARAVPPSEPRPRGMAATVVPPLHRPARAPHLDPRVARLAVRRLWPRRSCRVVARPGCRPEALSSVPARSLRGPPADAASARRGYGHYPRSTRESGHGRPSGFRSLLRRWPASLGGPV